MKHSFYFATEQEAQNFVNGSEVLNGTAVCTGIHKSGRGDYYYAEFVGDSPIAPNDAKVISDEVALYGCTKVYYNE